MTTVVVNTRRSTTPADPEPHRRQAAAGAWPIRASIAATAATCRWLVAVHRDKIAGVWAIQSQHVEEGRLTFALQPTPDTERLVGAVAPPGMRWRRGETWPIKIVAADPWTDIDPLGTETKIGRFRLALDPDGRALTVHAPRGATVTVVTSGS